MMHSSLIMALAPQLPAWLAIGLFVLLVCITITGVIKLPADEEAIVAASEREAITDDRGLDYDPEIVRARLEDETTPAPGAYASWHEYDLWNKRPRTFSADWWLLMRRLSREDEYTGHTCPGYVHHSVTRDLDGGYILCASYREVSRRTGEVA